MAPVEPREQFAHNLRTQRRQRGLSQEALGHASGLHRTETSLLERAGRDPRLSTISRLARALGIPAATLLDEID
jgi:transcriptional regulator with XRE-family HTH domain